MNIFKPIEFNAEGKIICNLCGKAFNRLGWHINFKHNISAKEYKKMYGLNVGTPLISKESAEKTRKKTLEHYDRVVTINLIEKGTKTRLKKGNKGRTKDLVRPEELQRLKNPTKKGETK